MSFPLPIVQAVLMQSPLHLIWMAGLAMAWLHREEHPKVSWLVLIALSLLLIEATLGTYLYLWLPVVLQRQETSMAVHVLGGAILNGSLRLMIQTVAWSLLLFSIFNWRTSH